MITTNLTYNNSHWLWAKVRTIFRLNLQNTCNILSSQNHSCMPRNTLQHAVFFFNFLANHTFSNSWNLVHLCKFNLTFRYLTSLYDVIRMLGFHQVHVSSEQSYFHNSRSTARKFHVLFCLQIELYFSTSKIIFYQQSTVTRKLEVYKNQPNALYINYTTIIKNTQI